MKYAANRPFADPEKAVRKPLEIANTVAPGSLGNGRSLGALDAGAGCPRLAHWNDGPSPQSPLGPFLFPNKKPGFWPGESKTFRT